MNCLLMKFFIYYFYIAVDYRKLKPYKAKLGERQASVQTPKSENCCMNKIGNSTEIETIKKNKTKILNLNNTMTELNNSTAILKQTRS